MPDDDEIKACLLDFSEEYDYPLERKSIDELVFSLKGLSAYQIRQVLSLAYQAGGLLDASDRKFILQEKEQIIKTSGILEMVNFKEDMHRIGGLKNLKDWLEQKTEIFGHLEQATSFGVDVPNGILMVGMSGCEKSLTAKATAAKFKVPLIRLDIGLLMGKYVGESEGNMRHALQLTETVSPVL